MGNLGTDQLCVEGPLAYVDRLPREQRRWARNRVQRSCKPLLGFTRGLPTSPNPSVESRKGVLILGPIWSVWRGAVTTMSHEPTRHSARSETTELANFDDDEGHIIGEGTVPPGSHAIKDCLLHLPERSLGRLGDQRSQAFDTEHVVKTVEHFD